jgi:hypothetical protein
MKLSAQTRNVLKNFGGIYQGMLFRPGNTVSICTKTKNFFAIAEVEETFDREFGIFDLRRFLSVVSMFEDPELKFDDRFVSITDGKRTVKYYYAEKTTFEFPPERVPQLPDPLGKFKLPQSVLVNSLKATGILQLPEICISGSGDSIEFQGVNTQNPTENTFTEVLDAENVIDYGEFKAVVSTDLLKIIPQDYEVTVTDRAISLKSDKLLYLVAVNS